MPAHHIQVDTSYLGELELRCRQIADDLVGLTLSPPPTRADNPVGDSMDAFLSRWEGTRGEIVTGLECIGGAFQVIRENFDQADLALADALQGETA
ncbi:MAG: hypothetical protein JJT89_13595 [Nitriliruptoraceae bacterium]|nr:hypothetical protein [Nitriliruptoraceae bacterium]